MSDTPLTDSSTVPLTLTYGTRIGDFVTVSHAATLERRMRAWADCATQYEELFASDPTDADVDRVRAEFARLRDLDLLRAPL